MSIQTIDTLVIIGAFLLMVGIPSFIIYKLDGGWIINLIISSLLFLWMVPDFGFFRTFLFLAFASFILLINGVNYQNKSMTSYEREQLAEKRAAKEKAELQKNAVFCPNCNGTDLENLGNNKKSFSVGKAIGGAALTGGIGTLAGFAGKKGKTDKWHCKKCGNVFDK